jgi:hypothetical protein
MGRLAWRSKFMMHNRIAVKKKINMLFAFE